MPSPQPPGLSWGLVLFCLSLIVLWFLLGIQPAHGQTENESAPPSLTQNLEQVEMNLQHLRTRLAERQRQIADLQSNLKMADARLIELADSLVILQVELAEAEKSAAQSQTALSETSLSLTDLSTRYDELERKWQVYRNEALKDYADLDRRSKIARRWAVGLGVSTAACLVVAVVEALLLSR